MMEFRFNPAYAGNINLFLQIRLLPWVQPRVCGEYFQKVRDSIWKSGSTPRMRGISDEINRTKNKIRFNPAYAGNI